MSNKQVGSIEPQSVWTSAKKITASK